jgi:hypothetical protein
MGYEDDCLPLSNAEVKNKQNYNSTPPHTFMAWHLLHTLGNFTFHSKKSKNHNSNHYRKFRDIYLIAIKMEDMYDTW